MRKPVATVPIALLALASPVAAQDVLSSEDVSPEDPEIVAEISKAIEVAEDGSWVQTRMPSEARGVSPKNQGRWAAAIQRNYPAEALRNGEQGTVRLSVTVDTRGRVSDCTVNRSSESVSLDRAACAGMLEFAEFEPARDAQGFAIESSYSTAIRYQIPERSIANSFLVGGEAPENYTKMVEVYREKTGVLTVSPDRLRRIALGLTIDWKGQVIDCTVLQSTGNPETDASVCATIGQLAKYETLKTDDQPLRQTIFGFPAVLPE